MGQRALSGRWGRARLVFIDLLVLLIQGTSVGILLAIEHLERQPGKQGPATVTSGTAQRATAAANAAIAALMRRGEHWIGRSQATPIAAVSARTAQEEEGIEMRELSTPMVGEREQREAYTRPQSEPVQSEEPDTSERSILLPINTEVPAIRGESASENGLSPSEAQGRRDLEALYSGESTLVNIYFWQILRDQHYERRNRALAGTV